MIQVVGPRDSAKLLAAWVHQWSSPRKNKLDALKKSVGFWQTRLPAAATMGYPGLRGSGAAEWCHMIATVAGHPH